MIELVQTIVDPNKIVSLSPGDKNRFARLHDDLESSVKALHHGNDDLGLSSYSSEHVSEVFLTGNFSKQQITILTEEVLSRPDIDTIQELIKASLDDPSSNQRSAYFLAKYFMHFDIQPEWEIAQKVLLGISNDYTTLNQFVSFLDHDKNEVLAELKNLALNTNLAHRQRALATSAYMICAHYNRDSLQSFLDEALKSNSAPVVSRLLGIIMRDVDFDLMTKRYSQDDLFKILYCMLAYPSITPKSLLDDNFFELVLHLAKQPGSITRLEAEFKEPKLSSEDDYKPMPRKNLAEALLNAFGFQALVSLAICKLQDTVPEELKQNFRNFFTEMLAKFMEAKDLALAQFNLPVNRDTVDNFLDAIGDES
ncbi:MAG: hypothetical protein O3C63_00210 [Cyanobacteria bacterium]|nr:hypothetical protein [Cyanobacteriota bacterium]